MLTRDEVLSMNPGRELDALIAEKVMGWKVQFMGEGLWGWMYTEPDRNRWNNVPKFSTDIAAAWEVMEEMGDCLHLKQHGEQGEWEAWFCGYPNSKAHGETAPEAICKAALLAVMEG